MSAVVAESAAQRRDFRRMWLGQSVSLVGDQISLFALPSLAILTLHATAPQVGVVRAMATVAFPALGLFVGAFMDRVRCRPYMIAADLTRLALFTVLAALALAGRLDLRQLYTVAALVSVCTVVFDVGYQTHLPRLVGRELLSLGNARLEMSASVARAGGPALGGAVTQLLGPALAVAANAASFVASAAGLLAIRTPESAVPDPEPTPWRRQILDGARYIWRTPLLRSLSAAAALRNLSMAMVDTVLLLFLYRALDLPPALAATVLTAGALAAVLGAAASRVLVERAGVGPVLLATVTEGVVWAAAPLALLTGSTAVVVAIAFVSALWLPVWNISVTTLRQLITPPHLLGRVHATARTVNLCTIPLGSLAGGLLAGWATAQWGERGGLGGALAVAGLVTTTGLPFLLSGEVRRLRRMPAVEEGGCEEGLCAKDVRAKDVRAKDVREKGTPL
ncbi:MFS transporter [Streptomyces cylindrosporus]|uniref:MFS transporter n=1 Tax=Streptomyces cylindrosporus TaxID=2927583 RepID=A0ABS9YBA5_9ACTN|nr:MFS transporter [Streptomyces cylindrosporus]MCI3274505.1 MFS transporter [Streptomyces cylindrosporus]